MYPPFRASQREFDGNRDPDVGILPFLHQNLPEQGLTLLLLREHRSQADEPVSGETMGAHLDPLFLTPGRLPMIQRNLGYLFLFLRHLVDSCFLFIFSKRNLVERLVPLGSFWVRKESLASARYISFISNGDTGVVGIDNEPPSPRLPRKGVSPSLEDMMAP